MEPEFIHYIKGMVLISSPGGVQIIHACLGTDTKWTITCRMEGIRLNPGMLKLNARSIIQIIKWPSGASDNI